LVLDAALICLFSAIGRSNHAETGALVDVVGTAWPFLAGMAVGWLIFVVTLRRAPLRVRDGIPIWLSTVALGMLLRGLTDAGTAFSFIVVATLFLGVALIGWRGIAALATRQRA